MNRWSQLWNAARRTGRLEAATMPSHEDSKVTLLLVATLAASTLAWAATVNATVLPPANNSRYEWAADGRLVDVSVVVNGSDAPLYIRPGAWDRRYVQAFEGRNYSLRLRNNSSERIGVLIAVDGLNVVNGERSSLSRGEAMYVLDPYETATIRGWRTSLSEVRRFVFVDEKRSYAERTNQANGDMGWIRVLAFREQRPLAWTLPKFKDDSRRNRGESKDEEYGYDGDAPNDARRDAAPAPSIGKEGARQYHGAPEAQESVPGTGWGDRSHDPVRQTQFLAAASPTDRITLRYEYASGLRALGILPVRNRIWERERGDLGFAKPPRW